MTSTGVDLDACGDCGAVWFDRGELLLHTTEPDAMARAIATARADESDDALVEGSFGPEMPFLLERSRGGVFVPGDTMRRLEQAGTVTLQWQPPDRGEPLRVSLPRLGLRAALTMVGLYGLTVLVLAIALEDMGWHVVLGASLPAVALGFLLAPYGMDLIMRWLYSAHRVPPDHVPPHLAAFMQRVCDEHRMKVPRLLMIEDGTPTAMTYGHTPSNARVVISSGLVSLLTPQELEAVVGHELGHARHWDIALMTLAEIPPQLLRVAYVWLHRSGSKSSNESVRSTMAAVVWAAGLASELVALSLSRTREYHADRFSADATGSASALARALVKIAYGLASQPTSTDETSAAGVRTLGIFDRSAATTMAISARSAEPSEDPRNPSGSDLQAAMKWDLWNPWASVYELTSTHPLVAKRLLHLSAISERQGEAPLATFDLRRPESYWDEFATDLVIDFAPVAVLLAMPALAAVLEPRLAAGVGLLVLAVAMAIRLWFRYRASTFPEMSVATLMRQVAVSDIRGIPCRLEGELLGRGEPGFIFSDDFTLRDPSGLVFLDHRQPFALWERLWGWLTGWKLLGSYAIVEGWFRRSPTPYVEVARYWVDGTRRRCWLRHCHWMLVFVVGISGVVLLVLPSLVQLP